MATKLNTTQTMATNVITTGAKALKLAKPSHILVTPYTSDGVKGTKIYDLEDVVRDTVSVTQDDKNETDIERETSDTPIYTITTLGKYQFTADVADTQTDLLADICGFTKDSDGKVYAPSAYKDLYAEVAVLFSNSGDTNYTALILPKLLLSSKATAESLNTNLAKITLSGTAQLAEITLKDNTTKIKVPYYVDPEYTIPTE